MNHWIKQLAAVPALSQNEVQLRLERLLQATTIEEDVWSNDLREILVRALTGSEFICQVMTQEPEFLSEWLAHASKAPNIDQQKCFPAVDESFYTGLSDSLQRALGEATSEQDKLAHIMQMLRYIRRREMLGIAWNDISGVAPVEQTLANLSNLADRCVELALVNLEKIFHARYGIPVTQNGKPQSLFVIAMGKLGGRELNYSSDIDLIFAYPEVGQFDDEKALSYAVYFERFAQALIKVLNTVTAEGFVFRVDMRLRPYGDSGPLVMTLDAMEEYYQTQGRNWERYALIKARIIAGDREAGQQFVEMIQPFVYRRYLDYDAFESLREMHSMIKREVRRKGMEHNLKLGAGGIREVEFIGQTFQLLRGGRETLFQSVSILDVLGKLASTEYIEPASIEKLVAAYMFLRRSENLLQEFDDKQMHSIPDKEQFWQRMAWLFNLTIEQYKQKLEQHRTSVHEIFRQVFSIKDAVDEEPALAQEKFSLLWLNDLDKSKYSDSNSSTSDHVYALLEDAGFKDTTTVLNILQGLRNGRVYFSISNRGRERLDKLMPLVITESAQLDSEKHDPSETLIRVSRLLESIAGRSAYLALLTENPQARAQVVQLCAASPWIAEFLTRHPILLDELLSVQNLYDLLQPQVLAQELNLRLGSIDADDLEQQMELLRHFKQSHTLKVAAADIGDVMPLMEVSTHLTSIAEVTLHAVLDMAWYQLSVRYGKPVAKDSSVTGLSGFAIIAYGKMGGIELGYGSDLDLVFLHDSSGLSNVTDGERSIDTSLFFARLAQRVIHILNTRTHSGILYEVDTRLRPNGSSGLLVSNIEAFEEYQRAKAWTWEHQALVRARVVAGDSKIADRFQALRREILCKSRDEKELRHKVCDMREKMRSELGSKDDTRFHLKQDAGGIADIEFIVQYAVLAWAHERPELIEFTDNIRQIEAMQYVGLIQAKEAELLSHAYRGYRAAVHHLTLEQKKASVPLSKFEFYRRGISNLWDKWIKNGHLSERPLKS